MEAAPDVVAVVAAGAVAASAAFFTILQNQNHKNQRQDRIDLIVEQTLSKDD